MKLQGWPARLLIAVGVRCLSLWARTLRYHFDDRAGLTNPLASRPFIVAIWHNRLLLIPYLARRFMPARRATALISASRDGALLADMAARFGFPSVRGSGSRRGASALLQLAEALERGRDIAITPDGPRGPVYHINPGIIFLAQKSGAPIVLMHLEFSRCWRLRSWDRFILPFPFSSVRIFISAPHAIAATASEEEFETERRRLQDAMVALVENP